MSENWILYPLAMLGWAWAAYLLGSIPEAWLLTKWLTGQDLRRMGSGNVGVMNTAISTARWAGLLVFLCELAKGALAVIVPRSLGAGEIAIGLCAVAVVVGTRWPVWLRFRGGRGNTAGAAALTMVSWQAMASLIVLWALLRLIIQNGFIATRINLLLSPFVVGFVTRSWWYAVIALALSLIYIQAQNPESDDHSYIRERWHGLWNFLTSPPRGAEHRRMK